MRKLKGFAAIFLAAALTVCLSGCNETQEGFAMTAALSGAPETLDPIYAQSVSEQTVVAHLYENLMKLQPDAEGNTTAVPGMAKSVETETNLDGTVTVTFRLRGAKWSDGKAVKAEDFVYAWQRLADPISDSPYADLLRIVCGYDEARESGDMTLLQVSAKNDTTLVVNLTGNYEWFFTGVCTAPATSPLRHDKVPANVKESAEAVEVAVSETPWWADAAAIVGNGTYLVDHYAEGESLTLKANEVYYSYGKQNNPRKIHLSFVDAEEAQTLYETGGADVVWPLSDAAYAQMLAVEGWKGIPTLTTYTLLFNCDTYPFWDPLLRSAVSKCIDRVALGAVAGVTAEAAEALVPYGVPDSEAEDFRTCKGPLIETEQELYAGNCNEALKSLWNAGYENGGDLGPLEYLYVDEGSAAAVAREVCRQLGETLYMDITPRAVTEEEMAAALEEDTFTLAACPVTALCNDAECFLMDWGSSAKENVVGYRNTAYDTLLAIIANAPDGTARLGCLHDAEELLVGDVPLSPLYTTRTAWQVRETLVGAVRDARGWFHFGNVTQRTA